MYVEKLITADRSNCFPIPLTNGPNFNVGHLAPIASHSWVDFNIKWIS